MSLKDTSPEIDLLRRFLTKQNKMTVNITAAIRLMTMKTTLLFPDEPDLFHRAETSQQIDSK